MKLISASTDELVDRFKLVELNRLTVLSYFPDFSEFSRDIDVFAKGY